MDAYVQERQEKKLGSLFAHQVTAIFFLKEFSREEILTYLSSMHFVGQVLRETLQFYVEKNIGVYDGQE